LEGGRRTRFGIAVAPSTRQEFSHFRMDTDMEKYRQYHPTPASPVVGVSWFDALEYCRWVQDNLPSNIGLEVRLPTDDEWELACRQGTSTDFFFGQKQEHFRLFGWYYANAVSSTMPVATLRPSPWGLFDMHGNVWEWIMDEYSQDGVKLTGTHDAAQAGRGDSRLLRGGAWCDSPTWCRATERSNPHWPSDRNLMFGFRVLCVEKHVAS
jgi:formylglycine-generating enzyme required for sulfatase activity